MKHKVKSSKVKTSFFCLLLLGGIFLFLFAVDQKANGLGNKTPVYSYQVVRVFPHDPKAFTQGLVYDQGFLYEGTGLIGKSSWRKVELETGKVVGLVKLPDRLFGEGVTLWEDKIIQLTWQSKIGLVYDRQTLRLLKKFYYPTEGWGLTQDGQHLIMSDGTAFLYFLDPQTFKEVRRIQARDEGIPIGFLNELEYIKGEIYANVYGTDRIVRIAPESGQVTGWIDLSGILPEKDRRPGVDVLNGIAYDVQKDRLFVTGKLWPKLFEIRLILLN
ncbi:MAG: glutaminyl-peptide cyclotransferase [Deltaproteobacteria bacterium]|nr:glutaminyl-peptide cyclotransferase [Deltaproteobacteria bacterium]